MASTANTSAPPPPSPPSSSPPSSSSAETLSADELYARGDAESRRLAARMWLASWRRDTNDIHSQWSYTKLLRLGDEEAGVRRDSVFAARSLRNLVRRGHVAALFDLAEMHEHGDAGVGGEASDEKAARLYEAAANLGVGTAYARLAAIAKRRGDEKEYRMLLAIGAEIGDEYAAFVLANEERDENPLRSFALMKRAADKGFAPAMHNVGVMLRAGGGGVDEWVDEDPERAVSYLEGAAAKGFEPACMTLAAMYWKGDPGVVKQSYVVARQLYERAVRLGVPDAQRLLDEMNAEAADKE